MGVKDEDDDDVVDINVPVELPLSKHQRMDLRNPWDYLSWEEEFYLFYDDFVEMVKQLDKSKSPIARALLKPQQLVDLRDMAINGSILAKWFATHINDPKLQLPNDKLVQDISDLNPEKLRWARTVKEGIKDDETVSSIWKFRFEYLLAEAISTNPGVHAMVTALVYDTPSDFLENHLEISEAESEINRHRYFALSSAIDKNQEKWNDEEFNSSVIPDVDKEFEEYGHKHSEEIESAFKKKNEAANRFMEKISQYGGTRKKENDKSNTSKISSLVDAFLKSFSGPTDEDCGNPDCPIHGKKSISGRENKNQIPQIPFQNIPLKQLPISTTSDNSEAQRTNTTMAPEKKSPSSPNNKKDDELKFSNVTVQFVSDPNSKAIALPDGMSLKEGRHWLQKIEEEETRTFAYQYQFKGWYPLDAMWAAYRALAELHGFVHIGDFKSFWGNTPPSMITIEVDYGRNQQIPWGPVEVNSFSAPLVPSIPLVEGQPTLQFDAMIRNNERAVVDKLMKRAEEMLSTSSIYRGKAIEVDFEVLHPMDFRFDPTKAPKFWNTRDTVLDEVILSKPVERLVKTGIWTPIRHTEAARKYKIPLRRNTLLAGKYGVGKTLVAKATARIAEDNGWTFIYLRKLTQLKEALYFARKYQPAVIFAEDVNRIVSGKRDAEMDELFNVVDGIDRKNDEVMLVFTTNNVEEIHPGMIRPGRIDTIITVHPPDADATARLIRLYGRGLIDPAADLSIPSEKLSGQIPAIIREAIERAKIAALEDSGDSDMMVSGEHLDIAADQALNHAEFLREPPEKMSDMEALGTAFGNVFVNGLHHALDSRTPTDQQKANADKRLHTILEETGVVVAEKKNGQLPAASKK